MNSTITSQAILVRILQISQLAGSGSGTHERPKCKNNELGFLYNINDPLLRPDTYFQHNRLKTVGGVPHTKRTNESLANHQREVDLGIKKDQNAKIMSWDFFIT